MTAGLRDLEGLAGEGLEAPSRDLLVDEGEQRTLHVHADLELMDPTAVFSAMTWHDPTLGRAARVDNADQPIPGRR